MTIEELEDAKACIGEAEYKLRDAEFAIIGMMASYERLRRLAEDAIRLLNVCCVSIEPSPENACPMWPDHATQCELRALEDRARRLGLDVEYDD